MLYDYINVYLKCHNIIVCYMIILYYMIILMYILYINIIIYNINIYIYILPRYINYNKNIIMLQDIEYK